MNRREKAALTETARVVRKRYGVPWTAAGVTALSNALSADRENVDVLFEAIEALDAFAELLRQAKPSEAKRSEPLRSEYKGPFRKGTFNVPEATLPEHFVLPSAAPIIENPVVHIELPPGAEPFYVDPATIRHEPSTPSPAKEEPGLPQWAAVGIIGLMLAVVLTVILFIAYPALWTPS